MRLLRAALGVSLCLSSILAFGAPHDSNCQEPDKNFKGFLSKFAEDRKFQIERSVFPLVARFGAPDAAPPTIELWGAGTVQDFKTPIILSRAERRKMGLEQEVLFSTEWVAEVLHFKPEADSYRVRFLFRKYRGCWYLEQFHDTAL